MLYDIEVLDSYKKHNSYYNQTWKSLVIDINNNDYLYYNIGIIVYEDKPTFCIMFFKQIEKSSNKIKRGRNNTIVIPFAKYANAAFNNAKYNYWFDLEKLESRKNPDCDVWIFKTKNA